MNWQMDWEQIQKMAVQLGPAGMILALIACLSIYLALRNTIYLFLVDRDFRRKFAVIENGDAEYTRNICGKTDNPLIGIIAGIVRTHATHSKDIRAEVAYLFHRNFESVTRGLTYLRLISVIAPLLGLLGTMLGMVKVFRNVAAKTAVDSTVLASGIWEALLTTIFGLSVAIPTLVFYYHLSLKLKGFRIEAIEHSYRAVEVLGVSCDLPDLPETAAEDAGGPKSADPRSAPPRLVRRPS
ncbi:MAG: MotA/TolQ/ExbB proton channel family protein [Desulfococcaceae bacterium]